MTHTLIQTSDGSTSLYNPQLNETYHSVHGALQETMHVFIKNGLYLFLKQPVSILEIGFGTGLNALVTFAQHTSLGQTIHYETVEAYPLTWQEASQMNYPQLIDNSLSSTFQQIHSCSWNETIQLSPTKNTAFVETKKNTYPPPFHKKSDSNTSNKLTTPPLSTSSISMPSERKYNPNYGTKISSKKCTMP